MKNILITGGSGFIGTNLIDYLRDENSIINIDIKPPINHAHNKYWYQCDILNKSKIFKIFDDHSPNFIVHLAARADVDGKTIDDYRANTEGTQNILEAIKKTSSIDRVIITSTQFVNQYQGIPKNDEDYAPNTVYGESKVITEKYTRQASLNCIWTIIRPTNIWGPWHWRYPDEFWKVLARGLYLHPKNQKVIRSYGYVKNVCWQIRKTMETKPEFINGKVLYVGDLPVDILNWVNEFSRQQTGKNVKQVDTKILKLVAHIGDILSKMNIKFPLTSSRLTSMTTSNEAPMAKTFDILGIPPYCLKEGVKETIQWLEVYHPDLIKVSSEK